MHCTNELCRGDVKLLKARVSGKWYLRCSKCDTISYVTRYNLYNFAVDNQTRIELLRQIEIALTGKIATLKEQVKAARHNKIRDAEHNKLRYTLADAEMELRLTKSDIQHIERNMRRVNHAI